MWRCFGYGNALLKIEAATGKCKLIVVRKKGLHLTVQRLSDSDSSL